MQWVRTIRGSAPSGCAGVATRGGEASDKVERLEQAAPGVLPPAAFIRQCKAHVGYVDLFFQYLNDFTEYIRKLHYPTLVSNLSAWKKRGVLQGKFELGCQAYVVRDDRHRVKHHCYSGLARYRK